MLIEQTIGKLGLQVLPHFRPSIYLTGFVHFSFTHRQSFGMFFRILFSMFPPFISNTAIALYQGFVSESCTNDGLKTTHRGQITACTQEVILVTKSRHKSCYRRNCTIWAQSRHRFRWAPSAVYFWLLSPSLVLDVCWSGN